MLAFRLTPEQAEVFFEVCGLMNAKTEEERTAVLVQMARMGDVASVVETKKTKEEYIQHLAKHFKVLNITKEDKK